MNDQPSKLPFNEYFSFDEYDIVPLEPGKASGDTLTVRLNQEGLNRVIGDLSALLERLYRPPLLHPLLYLPEQYEKSSIAQAQRITPKEALTITPSSTWSSPGGPTRARLRRQVYSRLMRSSPTPADVSSWAQTSSSFPCRDIFLKT